MIFYTKIIFYINLYDLLGSWTASMNSGKLRAYSVKFQTLL
jgi:hypothetical protein